MKMHHHAFAKAAIAATLTATLLAPRAAFSQSKPGANASDTPIHQAVNGPEQDPNMPELPYMPPGAPIRWTSRGAATPMVSFVKPSSTGSYLGFNEKGSWIRNENDRKVYVWNLKDRSLTLGAESDAGVPLDLRNPSRDMKDVIAIATGHASAGVTSASTQGRRTPYIPSNVAGDGNAQYASGEARTEAQSNDRSIHQAVNGPEQDPNMPDLPYMPPGSPIRWTSRGPDEAPMVSFNKPASTGSYLGFNEKGSWVRNQNDRKVYVWNLKDRTLTLGAESDAGVPLDLRNPSPMMQGIIANATGHGKASVTSASTQGRRTPYIPPSVTGDGNALHAAGEARTDNVGANTASASKAFKGSGATISAGVLTFILDDPSSSDNRKQMSFNVVRSAMNNSNAAKPTGIAGAWLGEDPKNNVIVSLYVQGEGGAVSGTVMTGMAAETLKRMMNANRQH